MTETYQDKLNSMMEDYLTVSLEEKCNDFAFNTNKKNLSLLYGKDIEKLLSYSSGVLGVASCAFPVLRGPALATGGVSWCMSFFTKKSKKTVREENLMEQVEEVKNIIKSYRDDYVLLQMDKQFGEIRLKIKNNYQEKMTENEMLREKFDFWLKELEEIFE
jgi:hypothetical protein